MKEKSTPKAKNRKKCSSIGKTYEYAFVLKSHGNGPNGSTMLSSQIEADSLVDAYQKVLDIKEKLNATASTEVEVKFAIESIERV